MLARYTFGSCPSVKVPAGGWYVKGYPMSKHPQIIQAFQPLGIDIPNLAWMDSVALRATLVGLIRFPIGTLGPSGQPAPFAAATPEPPVART